MILDEMIPINAASMIVHQANSNAALDTARTHYYQRRYYNYFGTDIVNSVCITKQYRFVLFLNEEFDMI